MSVKYTSNLKQFKIDFARKLDTAFDVCAPVGVKSIQKETPILSGTLKNGTDSVRETKDSVTFTNDVSYGPFVELGTMNQGANPFFKRGIFNVLSKFKTIIISNLKVK